jgi:hypothetical protein
MRDYKLHWNYNIQKTLWVKKKEEVKEGKKMVVRGSGNRKMIDQQG